MWNPESNWTCRDKNHFLFQWKFSTLPEQHMSPGCFVGQTLKITGPWIKIKSCQMHRQVSQDSLYLIKNHCMDVHGPWRNWRKKKKTSWPDSVWPDMWRHASDASNRKAKQKWAIEKRKFDNARKLHGISIIEPEDEHFKNIKTLVGSWKFRCLQQCLAKHQETAVEKPAAELGKARQNMLVLSKLTSPLEFDLFTSIMKIKLQRKE